MTNPLLSPRAAAIAAFALYAAVSIIFIDHGVSLTRTILGSGSDPFAFIWFLAWWPWAVSHHLDPLHAYLVWQPVGVILPWVTSVPFLALLGLPVTLLGGPVLTYNLFIICGPVFAALAAYALCLYVCRAQAASLIGGFLFGFSSYEMGQDIGTLNLSFTALVPCAVLLGLLRLDGRIGRRGAVALTVLLLCCEFMISIEIFATGILFGAVLWLLAFASLPARRHGLWRILFDALIAMPFVLILLSPFLKAMFADPGFMKLPALWPYFFSAQIFNFVIPTPLTELGGALARPISKNFTGDPQEQDAYLGLPLLLIIIAYCRKNFRNPETSLLPWMFVIAAIASLGPRLLIFFTETKVILPWAAFMHLPLIASALPCRFALYVSLAAAVIAALWITGAGLPRQGRLRVFAGCLACIALLPHFHAKQDIPESAFFKPGRVASVLGDHARILILPFALNGPSSFWQVESRFGFTQTGGYLGFPPAAMLAYPAVGSLFVQDYGPDFVKDLKLFCIGTKTQYLIAGPGTAPDLRSRLAQLPWPHRQVDDVVIYTVPEQILG
jgi:hypothetical protein